MILRCSFAYLGVAPVLGATGNRSGNVLWLPVGGGTVFWVVLGKVLQLGPDSEIKNPWIWQQLGR
jgi:hypothetical protein